MISLRMYNVYHAGTIICTHIYQCVIIEFVFLKYLKRFVFLCNFRIQFKSDLFVEECIMKISRKGRIKAILSYLIMDCPIPIWVKNALFRTNFTLFQNFRWLCCHWFDKTNFVPPFPNLGHAPEHIMTFVDQHKLIATSLMIYSEGYTSETIKVHPKNGYS